MEHLLINALIASLLSAGWTTLFWDGMIFGFVADWVKAHKWLHIFYKPALGCIVCNSFHVGLIFIGPGWEILVPLLSVGISSVFLRLTANFRIP